MARPTIGLSFFTGTKPTSAARPQESMEKPGVFQRVRIAFVGMCALLSSACLHTNSPTSDEIAAVVVSDSTRLAQSDRNRSSSSQVVDFDESERTRFNRVEQMIQGAFAGVTVTPNGGNYTIKIRSSGAGSITAGTDPLVIIDGASRSVSDLRNLSPLDVQRIEIMKDAGASFYGSRGANGVILITTRRGR